MSGRHRLRRGGVLGIAFAAMTLAPKLVLASASGNEAPRLTAAALAVAAERSGFRVVETHAGTELPSVVAQAGSCRILLVRVAPQGWNRSLMRRRAGSSPLRYLYAGLSFDEQPVLRTSLRFHWELLKRRAGFDASMPAVLALSWTKGCVAPPMPDVSSLRE